MLNILHYSVLLVLFSVIIIPLVNFFSSSSFKLETSVWCFEGLRKTKLCRFKNICYSSEHKTFLFFLGKDTVIKSFHHYSEFQKIQLSSVLGHNHFYANMSLIDIKNYSFSGQLRIYSKGLLFSRFKPNNLMHVIHDDLFPVFLTLESACLGETQCIKSYNLIFHDYHSEGPFFNLYKIFSDNPPIILNQMSDNNLLVCFKELLTGLVQDGVVYQYGFKVPHGPVKPSQLTQKDISRFIYYLKHRLQISDNLISAPEVILFYRQKNRRILNIDEVKEMIKSIYKKLNKEIQVNLIKLDLFSNDLKNLIEIISQADGLIGMHGAEMIFSLFLKPKSFVIEIFPFGIKPEVVSFIKPISELAGSNFIYFSWENKMRKNSVAHPNAHPLLGGISHLDEMTQREIQSTLNVPPVKCCKNSTFLYHMYQDTMIPNEFENFLFKSVTKSLTLQDLEYEVVKEWFYPHIVSNLTCYFQLYKRLLHISWQPPFNAQKNLMYSLYIRDEKGLYNKDVSTEKTSLEVETPVGVTPTFEIWISVYYNKFKSPDLYLKCY